LKLHEYEAKQILSSHGIEIPKGIVINTTKEAVNAFEEIGRAVVLKAQVLVAGRKKAGGIIMAYSKDEVEKSTTRLLKTEIKGFPVSKILVQERIDISQELYLGFTIDRSAKRPILIVSAKGGIDLEEIAFAFPEALVKKHISPLYDISHDEALHLAKSIDLSNNVFEALIFIIMNAYKIFKKLDCELLEINPLAVTNKDKIIAVDSRIIIDDNSMFRHPSLQRKSEEMTELENKAIEKNISFVEMDGEIGVIGNGAGLVLSTLDAIQHYGGSAANFLDLGGGAQKELVQFAVELVLKLKNVKVIILNILGGITRCDEVALGLVKALNGNKSPKPIMVRLIGTNEEIGKKILSENGITSYNTVEELIKSAVNRVGDVKQ
jgi:succinyl-CoA synthetase beta subunit